MYRKSETWQQAVEAIPATVERRPDLPYLYLRSRSTGRSFCMFIVMGTPTRESVSGPFNSHGLSSEATVPWF